MSKRQLKLWKQDGREPDWYARHSDPLHSVSPMVGCDDLQKLTDDLTQSIKDWMDRPTTNFQAIAERLKRDWIRLGGAKDLFEKAMEQAFLASGYYKKMLKG